MAVVETERIQQEIDNLKKQQAAAGPAGLGQFDAAIAQKQAELQRVQQQQADAGARAGGNTVTTERVKGDAFGLGSQLVQTVGLNQDAYAAGNYDPIKATAQAEADRAGAMGAQRVVVPAATATAAQIGTGAQDQSRQMQLELGNDLLAASRGQGPSVADAQHQKAMEDALAQQYSAAASTRGNRAVAERNAMANAGAMSQRAALDSGILRAQEQQAAQGQLANVAGGMRSQDLGLATEQAQLEQGAALANAQAATQANLASVQLSQANQQFMEQLRAQFVASGMNAEQAAIAAKQRMAELGADLFVRQEGMKQGLEMNASNALTNIGAQAVGGIASGIGSALGKAVGAG